MLGSLLLYLKATTIGTLGSESKQPEVSQRRQRAARCDAEPLPGPRDLLQGPQKAHKPKHFKRISLPYWASL